VFHPERGDRPGHLDRSVEVTLAESGVDLQRLEVAVLHTRRLSVEQPLGSAEPARTDRLLPPEVPREGYVHGQHRRRAMVRLFAVEVQAIGLFASRKALLDSAFPPGRLREGCYVAGRKRAQRPNPEEARARVRPAMARICNPRRLEAGFGVAHRCLHPRDLGFGPNTRNVRDLVPTLPFEGLAATSATPG